MGRAIYYCVQCSGRLSDKELEEGKALRLGDQLFCKSCVNKDPALLSQTPKPFRKAESSTRMKRESATRLKGAAVPEFRADTEEPPPTDGRRKALLIGGGGLAAALVVATVAVLAMRGRSERPAALPEEPVANPTGAAAPAPERRSSMGTLETTKEGEARKAFEKAKVLARQAPDDLRGQLQAFNDVVWKWDGTPAANKAREEVEKLKTAVREKVEFWLAALEGEIRTLVERKEYDPAAKIVDAAEEKHDLPEWKLAVGKRSRELRDLATRRREELGARGEFDKPPPPPPPAPAVKARSEEGKAYLARWEEAAARATARDYAGAIAMLEKAAAAIKEEDVRAEAAEDAADLKKVAALVQEALELLRNRPRGTGLSVDCRDPAGATLRVSGAILEIDAERVELRTGKESTFVEWSDVTGAALAALAKKAEPRAKALLCALEGENEAARAQGAELSAKCWTYAEGARARIPRPSSAEASARSLYYAAEKEYRSLRTRADAAEKYRTLRNDFAVTSVVAGRMERILRRSEAGKEYFIAPEDFRLEGTFRRGKTGKVESIKDSDPSFANQNTAEFEFAALPGQTYRCWLLAGGCCEETFSLFYQATELTDTHPQTKKKISCDPGANFASPLKHSIRNLKKTHALHAKNQPKTAARWEWIEIPLPKYASPGPKTVLFMTDQAGFSIGGAVVAVSALRKGPPNEAELKDLEKARAADQVVFAVDPELVGWWSMDEASGTEFADLSGRGHTATISGAVERTAGKVGGAVKFKDNGRLVVADAEDLRLTGDLTIAFWVRKDAESDEWNCMVGKGIDIARTFGVWEEPGDGKRVLFQQYNGGANTLNMYSQKGLDLGVWIHLTAVIEGNRAILYFNGEKDSETSRTVPSDAAPHPLGFGQAIHHAGFTGALDDVRIYRRALGPEEIRSLADMGR